MSKRQVLRTADDLGGVATSIAASLILFAVATLAASSLHGGAREAIGSTGPRRPLERTAMVEPSRADVGVVVRDDPSHSGPARTQASRSGAPATTAVTPRSPAVAAPSSAPRTGPDGAPSTPEPDDAISPFTGTVPGPPRRGRDVATVVRR